MRHSYERDRTEELVNGLTAYGIDALISIGGDGSMEIAAALARKGVRVIGVPKTIDNDLNGTVATFGFDTAVAFATESSIGSNPRRRRTNACWWSR